MFIDNGVKHIKTISGDLRRGDMHYDWKRDNK